MVRKGDGKVAITIGDVTGKGVTASVMMSATHGYLPLMLTREAQRGTGAVRVSRA